MGMTGVGAAFIPSPPTNGFHLGPPVVPAYGLAYVLAVAAAVAIGAAQSGYSSLRKVRGSSG